MIIYHARSPWHEHVVHLEGFEPWSSVRRAILCHSEISLQKGWILRWLEIQYWTTQFFEPPMVKLIWFELSWGRVLKNEGSRKLKFYLIYRKIPKISPRDYIFQRSFLRHKLKARGTHTSTHGRAGTSRMHTTISPGQWQPWTAFSPLYMKGNLRFKIGQAYTWREIWVSKTIGLAYCTWKETYVANLQVLLWPVFRT